VTFAGQLLVGTPARTPYDVADRLLAVQAQDPRGFRLAVRARVRPGVTARDVDAALDAGTLVVSWLNRGTLHLVTREDYWWLHALTTPPLLAGNARRLAQEGVPPDDADRGVRAVVRALNGGPLPRVALREAVAAAGVRTAGQAVVHVLALASLRGLVVRGPMARREQAYVPAAEWLGAPPPVDRGEALGRLAARYLAGHAPATDRDLAKWAGLPLRDARAGLALVPGLREVDGDRVALRGFRPPDAVPPPRLLGSFDPLLHGWASREPWLGPYEDRVVSGGMFRPFALVEGRAAAGWRYEQGDVALEPYRPLSAAERAALDADAADVRRYLG
jgi:hypothetical protein